MDHRGITALSHQPTNPPCLWALWMSRSVWRGSYSVCQPAAGTPFWMRALWRHRSALPKWQWRSDRIKYSLISRCCSQCNGADSWQFMKSSGTSGTFGSRFFRTSYMLSSSMPVMRTAKRTDPTMNKMTSGEEIDGNISREELGGQHTGWCG